jgi:hypothetical protein
VSDIGILNDPISLIAIALIFGSPGFLLGGIPGALLWRSHRVAGAFLGADPSTESKIYPRLRPWGSSPWPGF